MLKKLQGKLNIKYFVAIMIAIVAIVVISISLIIRSTRNYYYDLMAAVSREVANGYASNLSTANNATEIIDGIMEEKLLTANGVLEIYEGEITNEYLASFAEALFVDDIYYFNQSGVVINSASGNEIGWACYEGHPVYDFMISEDTERIEEVRPDSVSGIYYKFAYLKLSDNSFFKIGLLAQRINEFLNVFQMQNFLAELGNESNVEGSYYIDNNYDIVAFSGIPNLESIILTAETRQAIAEDEEYVTTLNVQNKLLFEVMMPIFVGENKTGTLVILHDTANTEMLIDKFNWIFVSGMCLVYILFTSIVILIYKKNNKLMHYAYHDIATDLPNKRYFEYVVNSPEKVVTNSKNALLLVQCKNFNYFNTNMGYQYSEDLFKTMSQKLALFNSPSCDLFQISSDKFVFLVKNHENNNALIKFAEAILKFMKSFLTHKSTGAQVGIVEFQSGMQEDANELLKKATIATKYLPEEELFQYGYFTESMKDKVLREEKIKTSLLAATSNYINDDFYLDYQPISNLKTNKIYGFEALARLHHKDFGMILPSEFIPIAEKTQLIVPLFRQIIQRCCSFIKTLQSKGYENIKISVNISEIQLLKEDFVSEILNISGTNNIKTSNLEIEISESVFSSNFEQINSKLEILKKRGINISVDNFGTGYSPLYNEENFGINCLKLDRRLINKMSARKSKDVIIGDIISMAHKIGNVVVAEGVENEAQKKYLIEHDCDYMQGYLLSVPLKQNDAIDFLKNLNI